MSSLTSWASWACDLHQGSGLSIACLDLCHSLFLGLLASSPLSHPAHGGSLLKLKSDHSSLSWHSRPFLIYLAFSPSVDLLDSHLHYCNANPSLLSSTSAKLMLTLRLYFSFLRKVQRWCLGVAGSRCSVTIIRTLCLCFGLGKFHFQADSHLSLRCLEGPITFELKVD